MTDPSSTNRVLPGPGALLPWLSCVLSAAHSDAPGAIDPPVDARAAVDWEDVVASRGGDHGAFERIVRRYQQEVARRLRRFSRDPLVIEELTHETFVQAFISLSRFRGDAPLVHWLHRIAVRAGYRYWKKERPRQVLQGVEPVTAPPPTHDQGRLAAVMDALPPRDRLVLTLLYLEGCSVLQTAALTGWSRAMVKVQAYRARGRLRALMRRDHERGDR